MATNDANLPDEAGLRKYQTNINSLVEEQRTTLKQRLSKVQQNFDTKPGQLDQNTNQIGQEMDQIYQQMNQLCQQLNQLRRQTDRTHRECKDQVKKLRDLVQEERRATSMVHLAHHGALKRGSRQLEAAAWELLPGQSTSDDMVIPLSKVGTDRLQLTMLSKQAGCPYETASSAVQEEPSQLRGKKRARRDGSPHRQAESVASDGPRPRKSRNRHQVVLDDDESGHGVQEASEMANHLHGGGS